MDLTKLYKFRCKQCSALVVVSSLEDYERKICPFCGAQNVMPEKEKKSNLNEKKTPYTSLTFTGKSGEYFKIWVVNVFLTILTIGIYSAWAKVRKKKYFYRSTFLIDSSFDYLAEPKKILKGRLIVFGALIIMVVAGYVDPFLLLILAIPAILLFPWLVVKALNFKARNSSYRNIRFDFLGTYGEAVRVFILQMLITMLTLGFGYPYQRYRRTKFVFNNGIFGGETPFRLELKDSGGFYRVYLWQAGGVGILLGIASQIILAIGSAFLPAAALPMVESFISLLASLAIIAFLRAAGTNLVWSNVRLGGYPSVSVYFRSTLSAPRMIWIYLSNAVAIVFSLGLLVPWASVRTVRYRLSNLNVSISGGLDSFVAGEQEKVEAVGEEIADFFDFDLGL